MTRARALAVLVGAAVVVLSGVIGGIAGLAYLFLYVVATAPGWPLGRWLFGRNPAGLVAGALLGYGITALCIWLPFAARVPSLVAFVAVWLTACAIIWALVPRSTLVEIPPWTASATTALCAVVLLVPLLTAAPFSRIGEVDREGNKRYRAYFTADFVWHEALTSELSRFEFPPRNPYMAHRPLNYYWAYYLLPAAATRAMSPAPAIETFLAVNALATGALFVGSIFVFAWMALPRPWAVAFGVAATLLASSAEGLYAIIDLLSRGRSLSLVRELNIDAITAWYFQGLSIDGLPRSIWWNPQHSLACALGLVALTAATRSGAGMRWQTASVAGTALGLALIMSPFPGGAMVLIYALSLSWDALARARVPVLLGLIRSQAAAILPVAVAFGWNLYNRTFEGAGGAVSLGLSPAARRSIGWVLLLALGPVLVPVVAGGTAALVRRWTPLRVAIAGVITSLVLMFGVTLTLEPIWIGWRAGQVLLVCCPPLVAAALAATHDVLGLRAAAAVGVLAFAVGFPTTVIDVYNAQDTTNVAMAAGFRWTVVIPRGEQEALEWIERFTPSDALVQMSLAPRGRETWSLIPSFARRRMSAGLPISLLRTPIYEERAARADRMFSSGNAEEASHIARELRVDYLYVGRVERDAFGDAIAALDRRPDLFAVVFRNTEAAVYAVK